MSQRSEFMSLDSLALEGEVSREEEGPTAFVLVVFRFASVVRPGKVALLRSELEETGDTDILTSFSSINQ